jgi:hypothetical protein
LHRLLQARQAPLQARFQCVGGLPRFLQQFRCLHRADAVFRDDRQRQDIEK